jgi:molybdate/tungstate transport system substrate-binding protein
MKVPDRATMPFWILVVIVVGLVAFAAGHFIPLVGPTAPAKVSVISASLYANLVGKAAQAAGVDIALQAAGSVAAARQVALTPSAFSLFASVDPTVISSILYPNDASWYISVAWDRMVLGYSSYASQASTMASLNARIQADLAAGNTSDALNATHSALDLVFAPGSRIGFSNPDTDPEGYRALMVLQLAGLAFYGNATHYVELFDGAKANGNVVTVDAGSKLFSYLQSGQIDYDIAIYESAALGSTIPYVRLAPQVDLGEVEYANGYAAAKVNITVNGQALTMIGAPVVLALTIPTLAPDADRASRIVLYLLSPDGHALMSSLLIRPLVPATVSGNATALPPLLDAVLGSSLLQAAG